jgi:3-hydroxyisobutyrate dehydrogenase-like beta-hydroxyacid dehydrogenase
MSARVLRRSCPARASHRWDNYATAVTLIGPAGAGQLAKMVNQICIAGLVQGLSEAVNSGQLSGLDMPLVLDVIGKGAAASWQMDNRGKTMIGGKFDYGFAVDWMRKDLGFCLDEAKRNGAPAGDSACRPVLRRRAGPRRQSLRYIEPDLASAQTQELISRSDLQS